MNLMDSLFDEFQDEAVVNKMDERSVVGWIEVCTVQAKRNALTNWAI